MTEPKRYASVKKVSLEGKSEEWGPECYAYVVPAGYEENLEASELKPEDMKGRAGIDYQKKFVTDHFISGKIKVFDGKEFKLTDMTPEDANVTPAVSDALYFGIMGIDVDPKVIREVALKNASQTSEESTTGTPSSEDSKPQDESSTS